MKIKTKKVSYDEVLKLPYREHKMPVKPSKLLKKLILALSKSELKKVNFHYESEGMDKLNKDEPCLILMNHSSFIDLKIAETIFKDRDLQIVMTSDGFVGKEWLMRRIGCIPTQKFVTDLTLVKDMKYCVDNLKTSVLLFPEASYSFDGTATPLPDSLGKFIKLLGVPVVFIETFGAFHRDPLYNGLRLRDVNVSAKVNYILSPEDTKEKSVSEINTILKNCFSFDYFAWQKSTGLKVSEDFRATGLERVLYKCRSCGVEGQMKGQDTWLTCNSCGAKYEMDELGQMRSGDEIIHIPDWYKWQREQVREEIETEKYKLDIPVDIKLLKDMNAIYEVGEGRLVHDVNGFRLFGLDGKLDYNQAVKASYSLYSDYFWYEIGDMICIGDNKILYYCFPKVENVDVAKARLATEEMYKLNYREKKQVTS